MLGPATLIDDDSPAEALAVETELVEIRADAIPTGAVPICGRCGKAHPICASPIPPPPLVTGIAGVTGAAQ